ncbi:MAG: DUF4435 domain-containing protein [Planctomycetota bacterium]
MGFDRTEAGIRNTPLFYRGKYLVYVEGKDDITFWTEVFPEKSNGQRVHFRAIGGDTAIEKRVRILLKPDIPDDDKEFVVARDSNYGWIAKRYERHPRLVETRYHSIENVMLCKCRIAKVIRSVSRVARYPMSRVERWLRAYDDAVAWLTLADVLNEARLTRESVMGNNCSRFCIDNEQPVFDDRKIESHIRTVGFKPRELKRARINIKHYRPRYYSRGHFYFSAVFRFIRYEVQNLRNTRNIHFSQEALYTVAFEKCTKCMENGRRIKPLTEEAHSAIENLRRLSGN